MLRTTALRPLPPAARTRAPALLGMLAGLPLSLAGGLFCLLAVQITTGAGGAWLASFDERWIYNAVPLLAAVACFRRAFGETERAAWLCIGLAILAWGLGDSYYTFRLEGNGSIPFPSLADAGYLAFYPPVYVALGLLVRSQVKGFVRSMWLDGLIAALTIAAVATSIVFGAVLDSIGGSAAAVATNLAYPLADALLLAIVLGVVTLAGLRVTRTWLLVGAGFGVFGAADSVYLYRVATNTYHFGTVLDLGWLAGMLLLALAASRPVERVRVATLEGRRLLVVPTFFATVCLVLEFVDHFLQLNIVALALTTAGLSAVIVRMALTIGDYLHVLAAARTDAVTDALTQIGNRRALMRDLHDVLGARGSEEHLLLLIDLDGFKSYNDRFGHPAGDALLTRLGGRLADALADCGSVYRLGGDEFCAIVRLADVDRASALERTTSSVSEEGDGFAIGASCGWIVLPAEAQTAADALGLVDRRMYQEKASRRTAGAGGHGVLVNVLAARDASLAVHTTHVIDMALAIAARLELAPEASSTLRVVAELHDIGKVALPEAILDKPGPLTDDEWELVRQHTIVGERIVNGAPGLEDVGAAIRATHERWQGGGYPDGLRGEQIPLTARIVAVADAYEAMTSGRRPYRPPRTHEAAVAEIAACSGEQFDPSVVAAFLEAMSERAGEAQTAAAAAGVKSAGSRSTGSQNVASAGMLATSTRSVR